MIKTRLIKQLGSSSRYFAIYHQLADTFLEKMQGMTTLKVYQNDSSAEQELAEESEHFRQITMKVLTMQLGSYFHIGMNGMKASDQIFAFLDLPEKAAGQTSPPKKMSLTVSELSFTYPDADQAALNQINLSIVGLSGSGKSSGSGSPGPSCTGATFCF
ncbi:hypothetical protein [Lactobacillus delbrueckii]|uniref:hypothetical protein n=1 Tax=Lactobacillus delbrueckii TaxID=1584 RepID=UPI0025B0F2E9|nr:hypothetical protein [Lactobacillus delbrueckii]